jgi:hypothetical protein
VELYWPFLILGLLAQALAFPSQNSFKKFAKKAPTAGPQSGSAL